MTKGTWARWALTFVLAVGLIYHGWSGSHIYPFLFGLYLAIDLRLDVWQTLWMKC